MRFAQNLEPSQKPRRRLKTKPLLMLIGLLFIGNVFWFIGWLVPNDRHKQSSIVGMDEEVASVEGKPITREEWMTAMEKRVGREVLQELVNQRVMKAAAEQYGIHVSEKEIDLELALIRSVDGRSYTGVDVEQMRSMIQSNLILEKVLTKDVVIEEKAVRAHYTENASLYNLLPTYRTSVMIVSTEQEARQALDELKKGSSFEVLAKERSIDLASASLGGDIGYIHESTEWIDPAIVRTATSMKANTTSNVIPLQDGTFAVLHVTEVFKGQTFDYKEVKEHIQRELAMEQLPQSVSPEAFWKEFDTTWFYGNDS